jgi:hypothetical protein
MVSAFVWWTCSCGIKVKAGLDMARRCVTVQCADPSCRATRTIPGQIMQLSVETEDGQWRGVDVNWLIYLPQEHE